MITLEGFDSIWQGYMDAAQDIANTIEGKTLNKDLLLSIQISMDSLWNDWRAREPYLPRIDAWIDPRSATFVLIVRPR